MMKFVRPNERWLCPARGCRGAGLMACRPGLAAFTLIEVFLAVAISAVVLAAMNTVLFGALHLRNRTAELTEGSLPMDRAVTILKRDLRGIVPPGALAGPMVSDTTAVGMSQPVLLELFTTTGVANEDLPWGDVQRIDYALQEPTNRFIATGKDLIRNVTRNLLASTPETPDPQFLLGDVQQLKFTYYDGTNWLDTWSVLLSNTPAAVRVQISFTKPKSGAMANAPIEFVVPVCIESRTNQTGVAN